jgi:hypothetical protein
MTSKNPRPAAKAFGEIFEKLLGELKWPLKQMSQT